MENPVKLVVWDLDDTFWSGTLSEGGVSAIPANIEAVRTLVSRGIMSSICSKNDFDAAKRQLQEFGVWELFVFPVIQWEPKGHAVRDLINRAQLRPANVLFVDDNPNNLAEAKFYSPELMCASSVDLSHPNLQGKPDPECERWSHYKLMESRTEAKVSSSLSNEEFLRQSGIEVAFDLDVEPNLDRVLELINRTNQLNFTKTRVESDLELAKFLEQLSTGNMRAGLVRVKDRFGDYGIVGFYMVRGEAKWSKYEHLVFSCRILNMGVEQYVHEQLGEPVLEVQEPVANSVQSFACVDWINIESGSDLLVLRDLQVAFVGGCDVLQMAHYCSTRSVDCTHVARGEWLVIYADPSFFLEEDLPKANPWNASYWPKERAWPFWTKQDRERLDETLATSDVVVLSIYQMMLETYFADRDGRVRLITKGNLKQFWKDYEDVVWFVRRFKHMPYTLEHRLDLVRQSIKSVLRKIKPGATVFVLDKHWKHYGELPPQELPTRKAYCSMLAEMSVNEPSLQVIPTNELVPREWLRDEFHYTRQAFFEFAQYVSRVLDA